MILFLSMPLFGLMIITGMVEGLVRRDLRRYGAGYESSFVCHHAKRFIKPAQYGPCMLYLSSLVKSVFAAFCAVGWWRAGCRDGVL